MSFGAFSRTRVLRAKSGITTSVEKWWSKQRPAEGEVRDCCCCCWILVDIAFEYCTKQVTSIVHDSIILYTELS